MRWMATAGLLLILPVTAAAQGFELGGSISQGCTGDSSGFCSGDIGPMPAVHAALWVSPKVQIALRVANLRTRSLSTSEVFFAAGVRFGTF